MADRRLESSNLRFSASDFRRDWPKLGLELAQLLQRDEVDERACYATELILEEWMTNVLRHGATRVDGHLSIAADSVVIEFEDDGPGFDPTEAVAAPRPSALSEATPGGLGLTMIRRAAQDVIYERRDSRNLLRVRVGRIATA